MQVLSLDVKSLHTDESLGFLGQVLSQTNLVTVEADQVFIQSFSDAVKAFEVALKPNIKNSYTDIRKQADEVTHEICVGLRLYAEGMTYHPDATIQPVADKVFAIIGKYGQLSQMGYKELYPNLQAMLIELKAIPEDLSKLWMQVWIDALSQACDDFMAITEEKIMEDTQKEVGIVQEKRIIAEEAYKNLVNRINAGASYNGSEPYESFMNAVNVVIEEYKAMLSSRKTRNINKKKEEEEKNKQQEENKDNE